MCLVLGYAMVKNTVCRRVWDQVAVTPGSIYTAPLPVLPVGFDLLVNRENPKMLSTRSLPPGRVPEPNGSYLLGRHLYQVSKVA